MPISITGQNGDDQKFTMMIAYWLQNNLTDGFYGNHPVWKKIQMLNRVVTGGFGTEVRIPVKYPAAGGPQLEAVQDPFSEMSFSAQTGITHSKWQVAQFRMPIAIPERELVLEGSNTKKLSYLDSIMEVSLDKFNDGLKQQFWAAEASTNSAGSETALASIRTLFNKGGGSTTGPYSPAPLADQLGNAVGSGSPITLVGGIERNAAGAGYFCPPVYNPGTADTIGKAVINKIITLATRGSDKPDLLILERNHYDQVMGILQSQRVIQDSKLSDFGFDAFSWRGCDVVWDDDVPIFNAGTNGVNAFAINTKALQLLNNGGKPTVEFLGPNNSSAKRWKANWFGQLVMTKMGRGSGARHANLNV